MDLKSPLTQADPSAVTTTLDDGGPAPVGTRPPSRWGGLAQPAFLVGLGAALSAYVYAFDPNEASLFPACPLNATTGLDCPVCGSTRAVHALLHGDIGSALDHNLALVVLLPLFAYLFVSWGAGRVGYALPRLWRPWMRWGAVALVAAFMLARNLPFEPLSYLDATAGP